MLKVAFDGVHRKNIDFSSSEKGLSRFVEMVRGEGYEATIISEDFSGAVSELPPRSVLWLYVPSEPYTDDEMSAISDFLFNGGGLLLNSEWGNLDNSSDNLNKLLSRLELTEYFNFDRLVDEYHSAVMARNGDLEMEKDHIVITGFAEHPITKGIGRIGYYSGCSIECSTDKGLAWSSPVSFSDMDGNMELDDTEEFGEKAVAFHDTFENGRIVGIGDSSLIENAYFGDYENKAFIRNTVLWLSKSL